MGTVLLFVNILHIYFTHSLYLVNMIIIMDLYHNIY